LSTVGKDRGKREKRLAVVKIENKGGTSTG